jgi:hypothetical protein
MLGGLEEECSLFDGTVVGGGSGWKEERCLHDINETATLRMVQ